MPSAPRAVAQPRMPLLALVLVLALGSPASTSASQPTSFRLPAFAPDHVLVGFDAGTPRAVERSLEASVGARERGVVGAATHLLQVAPGRVLATVEALKRQAAVRYAEPDWTLAADQIPNDPGFSNEWGFSNTGQTIDVDENTSISGTPGADIRATAAWDVTTGTAWDPATSPSAPVVGVVDSGVYYNHPDLAPNMWSDPLPFDFKYSYTDSSGALHTDTTCPKGSYGWDSIRHLCDPYDPAAVPWHGTIVSGIIGAKGNNSAGHYPCSFDNANTFGSYDATTGSFTPDTYEQSLGPAKNVICVASSDYNDQRSSFSNWGPHTIQLAAPGTNIYSTNQVGSYSFGSGTSFSTPFVSGVAALLLSLQPDLDVVALKHALVGTYAQESAPYTGCPCGYQGGGAVDQLVAFTGLLSTGGGRLDACTAIPGCGGDYALAASPASQSVTQGVGTSYTVTIAPSGGF